MTSTLDQTSAAAEGELASGRVVQVIGSVVDVEFPRNAMPDLFHALKVDVTLGEQTQVLTLEVEQHLGDNVVRTISMQQTDAWSAAPRCATPATRSPCRSAT